MIRFAQSNFMTFVLALVLLLVFSQCNGASSPSNDTHDPVDSLIDQNAIDVLPDSFREQYNSPAP